MGSRSSGRLGRSNRRRGRAVRCSAGSVRPCPAPDLRGPGKANRPQGRAAPIRGLDPLQGKIPALVSRLGREGRGKTGARLVIGGNPPRHTALQEQVPPSFFFSFAAPVVERPNRGIWSVCGENDCWLVAAFSDAPEHVNRLSRRIELKDDDARALMIIRIVFYQNAGCCARFPPSPYSAASFRLPGFPAVLASAPAALTPPEAARRASNSRRNCPV